MIPSDYSEDIPVKIGLVLTGGGSHGAFEAGVLEAILPTLMRIGIITNISGTSAGAGNAVVVGSGLNSSGSDEAIRRLRLFWNDVKSNGHIFNKDFRFLSDKFLPTNQRWPNLPKLSFNPMDVIQSFMPSMIAQYVSSLVQSIIPNWSSTVMGGNVRITVNTVLEGSKAFTFEHVELAGEDLTPDGVGASANLKQLGFHFIKDSKNDRFKNRRAYDGAYAENGPLNPHLNHDVTDIIMIVLHDRRHNKLDVHKDIKHADIHLNALHSLASDTPHPQRLHAIEIESLNGEIGGLLHLNDSSKMNTNTEFIDLLYQTGISAGKKWLEKNSQSIGNMSSYIIYSPALRALENHAI